MNEPHQSDKYLLCVGDDVVVDALLGEVDDVEAEVAGLVVWLRGLAVVHSCK